MNERQLAAIKMAAKEGYIVAPPEKLDDDAAYRKRGQGIPKATRKLVYRRDGYQCATCGATQGLQIHHAVKRSLGGSDFPENLITLCWKCHAVAHGMKFDDFPEYINEEWMEQAIVEYLSDYYAENRPDDPIWYPYK